MKEHWEEKLSGTAACSRCNKPITQEETAPEPVPWITQKGVSGRERAGLEKKLPGRCSNR